MRRAVFSAAALVGLGTALSRLLGFARDVLVAVLLGAGPAADAFLVAFRLPGMVRRVLGEGGLNAGLVPIDHRIRAEEGDEAARRFAGEALTTLALGLLVLIAVAEIVAPWVVLALAGGYAQDAERLGLATLYLRLMLPLVAAVTLSAVAAAILNAAGKVLLAAFAPVVVNVVLVAVLAALLRVPLADDERATILAVAVSVAGVIQLALLVPALFGGPDRPILVRPRLSPPVRRMLRLGLPGLVVAAASQLAVLVAVQVASHTPSAVSLLYFADRVFQLPLGFVSVGVGVVLLPEIARHLHGAAGSALHDVQNRALEGALLLAIPATVALVLLAGPIVSVLFQHGAFSAADAQGAAGCLAAFAPGLVAAAAARVMAQPFLARENVRVPLLSAAATLVVTWATAVMLEPGWGVAGIAAGVTLGAFAGAGVLALVLAAGDLWMPDARLHRRLPRTAAASAAMAVALIGLLPLAAPSLDPALPPLVRAVALGLLCLAGLAVFAAAAFAFGAVSRSDMERTA